MKYPLIDSAGIVIENPTMLRTFTGGYFVEVNDGDDLILMRTTRKELAKLWSIVNRKSWCELVAYSLDANDETAGWAFVVQSAQSVCRVNCAGCAQCLPW